ncbi:hypothetical protein [Hyphobacterium sp.]|uniref:hypothetical protein n=1 Tax=Hyphobacterium sp. TaxID=2004662 RepID=UPI003BA8BDB8
MAHAAIERFEALQSAFFAATKRSERAQARFAAMAGLSVEDDPETLVRRTLREREAINAARSKMRAPSSSLRLVYGAALAAARRDGGGLVKLMEALETERKRRGGRRLYAAGSRAALVMLCAGGNFSQTGMYFDILEAIAAPWWRRKAADEETFAALMAATGETPETALERLERADAALNAAGAPKRICNDARFLVAVTDPQIDDFTSAWTALNIAVQQRRGLRQRAGWTSLAMLAAQVEDGSDAGDALLMADEFIGNMRPRVHGMTRGRLAVRLAATMTGLKTPGAAAADYAAILATQAAVIAATSASAAAVVAAT